MLEAGTKHALMAAEAYKFGRVNNHPLRAILDHIEDTPETANIPNPREAVVTTVISTAQVVKSGAGRLYKFRVENLSADDIIVKATDGADGIQILTIKCNARVSASVITAAEAPAFAGDDGAGVPFATSLRFQAYLASGDGTTTAASGVTVKALYA